MAAVTVAADRPCGTSLSSLNGIAAARMVLRPTTWAVLRITAMRPLRAHHLRYRLEAAVTGGNPARDSSVPQHIWLPVYRHRGIAPLRPCSIPPCHSISEDTMIFPDSPGMSGPVSRGSAPPLESPVYALGSSPAERERLRRQSEELRALSTALLDRVGVERGWNAVDLGCGPSGIIDLLAGRVGPEGHVTGLDVNPANVALAREFADELGLVNADIAEADARGTGLPPSSFDLAHARTLLVTIPDPAAVVAEMVRLVRPGGRVASVEPDGGGSVCYPPHPAWDRLSLIYWSSWQSDGADLFIGRRLPELFRQAGLVDIGVEAKAEIYPAGHSRRTVGPDLVRSMRPKIVERGIASEQELDDLDQAVRQHLNNPHTLVMPNLLFLAWGRKPVT